MKETWKPVRRNSPQSLFYGGRTVAKKKAAKKAAPKKAAKKAAPKKAVKKTAKKATKRR